MCCVVLCMEEFQLTKRVEIHCVFSRSNRPFRKRSSLKGSKRFQHWRDTISITRLIGCLELEIKLTGAFKTTFLSFCHIWRNKTQISFCRMKDIDFLQVDLFVHWYFWLGVVDGSYLEKVQKSMFYFQV